MDIIDSGTFDRVFLCFHLSLFSFFGVLTILNDCKFKFEIIYKILNPLISPCGSSCSNETQRGLLLVFNCILWLWFSNLLDARTISSKFISYKFTYDTDFELVSQTNSIVKCGSTLIYILSSNELSHK